MNSEHGQSAEEGKIELRCRRSGENMLAGRKLMATDYGNGKICYVEFPAKDIAVSSEFYRKVFGWSLRTRGDGAVAFDDGVGQVSGTWVLGRPPAGAPGSMLYIMVDDAAKTVDVITTNGGKIVQEIGV